MKGYGVRVTTIEGQNTFAPTMLCFMPKIHMTDDQNTWSDNLRVIEGPNTSDKIVFCAFHSFLT